MSDEVKVVLRDFYPDLDSACIYATWRNSAYYGVPRGTEDAKEFFADLTQKIKDILPGAKVRVACLEDDPSTILGYSVATGTHLDWIYVKVEYRHMGIGNMLMPKDIETVTDRFTKIGRVIFEKKNLKTKEKQDAPKEAGSPEVRT
jgi:GNAT superfamily N-acetyltransferase